MQATKAISSLVVEDGLDHAVLRQVAAAAERVVVEDDVARVEVLLADLEDRPLDDVDDRPEMGWAELGLRDHLALGVEDRAREVEPFVEERRVRRVAHRDAHLAGGRDEVVVDDLERDLVDVGRRSGSSVAPAPPASRRPAGVRIRLPYGSTSTRCPGRTSVVDIASSITAGPSRLAARAAASSGRRSAVGNQPPSPEVHIAFALGGDRARRAAASAPRGLSVGPIGDDLEVDELDDLVAGCRSRRGADARSRSASIVSLRSSRRQAPNP